MDIDASLRASSARKVDIMELQKRSVEWLYKIPAFISIIRHAGGEEDSEVSCTTSGDQTVKAYLIPKQFIVIGDDKKYGHFVFTRVIEKATEVTYWLVAQYGCTNGFLLLLNDFSSEEAVLSQAA